MLNEMKYFTLLGFYARDKVTGFEGVVDSVSFDLYGCVQIVLRPSGLDKDGELKKGCWFDWKRLEVTSNKPVMERPKFEEPTFKEPGPSDKPMR